MKILVLGDVFGNSGMKIVIEKLPELIKKKNIEFTIANGENAAESGFGITKKNADDLFNAGVNVITSGNHVWDQKETVKFIDEDDRLLRPENLIKGQPGKGYGNYISKNKKKITVINLMGNVFMKKSENVFESAKTLQQKIKLKENTDFIVVDMHAETTSEKLAMGHFFDGKATIVIGTHTHVPTSDHRILEGGTAFQTDLGMCGDYDSVIGMDKNNSIMKFLGDPSSKSHYPAKNGIATLSGVIVEADNDSGLAKKIEPIVLGGSLQKRI